MILMRFSYHKKSETISKAILTKLVENCICIIKSYDQTFGTLTVRDIPKKKKFQKVLWKVQIKAVVETLPGCFDAYFPYSKKFKPMHILVT
jgi:hypothetical protein